MSIIRYFRDVYLLTVFLLVGVSFPGFSESLYDGVILGRSNVYDAYPTHMYVDGVHHIYYCGGTSVGGDGLFHSSTSQPLIAASGWTFPTLQFSRTNSPWAEQHVCDPTMLRGEFSYNSASYQFALFYTADDGSLPVGVRAGIGVAFSNDLLNWTSHDSRAVEFVNDPGTQGYGAGEGSAAWDPQSTSFNLAYRDSSFSPTFWGSIVHRTSSDGVTYSSPPTELGLTSTAASTVAPDIAFSPHDGFWYALRHVQPLPTAVHLLRSSERNTLLSTWDMLEEWDMAFSSEETNIQSGFARNENGTLFVDDLGFMYVFFTTGDWFPNFNSWKISQIRRHYLPARAPIVSETFTYVGPFRAPGRSLNGAYSEIGGILWTAGPNLVFNGGTVSTMTTGAGEFATVPISEPGIGITSPIASVRAKLDPAGSNWAAIGFSTNHAGVFGGEVWMLVKNATQTVDVTADGLSHLLTSVPIPQPTGGFSDAILSYDQSSNTVSAWVNGEQILSEPDRCIGTSLMRLDRALRDNSRIHV